MGAGRARRGRRRLQGERKWEGGLEGGGEANVQRGEGGVESRKMREWAQLQAFFKERGYKLPTRCKGCLSARKEKVKKLYPSTSNLNPNPKPIPKHVPDPQL